MSLPDPAGLGGGDLSGPVSALQARLRGRVGTVQMWVSEPVPPPSWCETRAGSANKTCFVSPNVLF